MAQDDTGRSNDTQGARLSAGKVLSGGIIGAILAFIAALLFKLKATRAGDEDSPIIIKAGSFSVAIDDAHHTREQRVADNAYSVESHTFAEKNNWIVSLASLEAGMPVSDSLEQNVTSVRIYLSADDGTLVDTVTVTFSTDIAKGVLTFTSANDHQFDLRRRETLNVKKGAKRHGKRLVNETVVTSTSLNIKKVETFPGPKPFEGTEVVLAFRFV